MSRAYLILLWNPYGQTPVEEAHMATRSLFALGQIILILVTISLLPLNMGYAQETEGRWSFGIHGGANIWYNEYNKRVVGEGGEIIARFGFSRTFSAGLSVGYEELKSNQNPSLDGTAYMKLQAIPASVVGWLHLAPGKSINPFVYAGVGVMVYQPMIGGNVSVTEGNFSGTIHVPVGVGFEAFTSKDVSLALDLGYRFLDDHTDGRTNGILTGYAIAKVGVNFYLGASAGEEEELARVAAQRIKDVRETRVQRLKGLAEAEALRLRVLADQNARRIKDSTEAEAWLLAEQNVSRPLDTEFMLLAGQNVNIKGINFENDNSVLTESSRAALRLAFNALVASPEIRVLIVGHTDNVGRAAHNKRLSLRRAQTVMFWLAREGISQKRLTVTGEGSENPIDDNSTAEGRANNRRIEFRVLK